MATFKIGALVIRTVAKPLANSLKQQAQNHPTFKRACISLAQGYHRVEENLKMKFLGYKVETIRPLNEARAVELGSSFLAEFFIFGVAGSLVAYEAIRSSQKSSDRNKQIDTDIAQLQSSRTSDSELLSGLTHKVELLEQENDALRGAATSLLSIVCLKEAQQRAWVPGFHQEALDNELLHIKRYLDTAKEAEGKRRMELGVIGEVESLNGTVTP